uniref:Ig-like domain-containing protein n=1 Tax=Bos mutus grunniens TaxID=30521 RepID=A0A8B9WWE7_BOSMU
KQSDTGTESAPFSRYDEYQYLKELDVKVCPCIKRVKNHEDTKKSLAESLVDTDLLPQSADEGGAESGGSDSPRGEKFSLICNYSISMTSVQWFQQNPDGRLISLFYIASGMQQKGRLKSTINSKERYSQLYIRDSQPGDSATYFCAVETQCSADTCSLYTKP